MLHSTKNLLSLALVTLLASMPFTFAAQVQANTERTAPVGRGHHAALRSLNMHTGVLNAHVRGKDGFEAHVFEVTEQTYWSRRLPAQVGELQAGQVVHVHGSLSGRVLSASLVTISAPVFKQPPGGGVLADDRMIGKLVEQSNGRWTVQTDHGRGYFELANEVQIMRDVEIEPTPIRLNQRAFITVDIDRVTGILLLD